MSKESIKTINKMWKVAVVMVAAVIAILAICQNIGHLFTAALVLVAGLNTELVNSENYDLI